MYVSKPSKNSCPIQHSYRTSTCLRGKSSTYEQCSTVFHIYVKFPEGNRSTAIWRQKKTYFWGLQLQLGGHGSVWIIPEEQNKSTTDLAVNKHSYVTSFNRHVYVNIVYYAHIYIYVYIYIYIYICVFVYTCIIHTHTHIYIYIYVLQNPNCLITRGYFYYSMHFTIMISITPWIFSRRGPIVQGKRWFYIHVQQP